MMNYFCGMVDGQKALRLILLKCPTSKKTPLPLKIAGYVPGE